MTDIQLGIIYSYLRARIKTATKGRLRLSWTGMGRCAVADQGGLVLYVSDSVTKLLIWLLLEQQVDLLAGEIPFIDLGDKMNAATIAAAQEQAARDGD